MELTTLDALMTQSSIAGCPGPLYEIGEDVGTHQWCGYGRLVSVSASM